MEMPNLRLHRHCIWILVFISVLGVSCLVEPAEPGSMKEALSFGFLPSTEKVGPGDSISSVHEFSVSLAGNEYEGLQLILQSRKTGEIELECTPFFNEDGQLLESRLYMGKYIRCISDRNYGTYPDALIPLDSKEISLEKGMNLPIYISLHAASGQRCGTYRATLKATDPKEVCELFTAEITAHVWNFSLPETPSCRTAFGIHTPSIFAWYDPSVAVEVYGRYVDYLLNHKITPHWMNATILSEEGSEKMSDSRRTSFIIPYNGDDSDEAQFAKVSSSPEWLGKSFFYVVDEPSSENDFAQLDAISSRLSDICPGYHMITPFNTSEVTIGGKRRSVIDLLEGKSDILCPISSLFSSSDFRSRIDRAESEGSRIWWYVCSSPGGRYCNFLINQEALRPRILFWQQKALGIEGMLYWETSYWAETSNPWTDPLTTPSTGNTSFGDGSLFYPGEDGPVASLRLEAITDGIEDYEYLTMAEELFGRDYVDDIIARVTTGLTTYTLDSQLFEQVRKELGDSIEAEIGGMQT